LSSKTASSKFKSPPDDRRHQLLGIAPTGFYIRDASNPTYVSFCLSQKQAEQFPAIACTTADDRKPRILKEIGHVANGAYWVISSHPDAIDSDTIGYVRESQLKAKWRLLWEFER
jgi:hypothetical protein